MLVVVIAVCGNQQIMPSSDVRYQRGDHYRAYDDDLLRTRRSSSSASSSAMSAFKRPSPPAQKHFGSNTSAENAAVRRQINRVPYTRAREEEFLTKKKVRTKQAHLS